MALNPYTIPPNVPINPPPPGVTSNFDHSDQSRYVQMIATVVVCTFLSATCVFARLYTRIFLVKSFGWDDAWAALSMALVALEMACMCEEVRAGLTDNDWDISLRYFLINNYASWLLWNANTFLVYMIAFTTIKLSICCLYLRLLGPTYKKTRIGVWILMAYVVMIMISGIAGLLSFCHPVGKLFNVNMPGTCNYVLVQFFAQAVLQVSSDLLILIPPIPMVWRLNMSTPKKIGFVIILCIGLFVTGLSIVRLYFLSPGGSEKSTFSVSGQFPSTYWTVFEINFALIAACLPALNQFFIRIRMLVSQSRSKSRSAAADGAPDSDPVDQSPARKQKQTDVSQIMNAQLGTVDEEKHIQLHNVAVQEFHSEGSDRSSG